MSKPIHDLLCHALYSANLSMQKVYRDLLAPMGLTYPQYLVMTVLWHSSEPPTVKEIGAQVQLESSTLTPLLKRMEKMALIERTRDIKDERQVRIALTSAGRAMEQQASDITQCVENGLSGRSEDLQTTRDILKHLSTDLLALASNDRSK